MGSADKSTPQSADKAAENVRAENIEAETETLNVYGDFLPQTSAPAHKNGRIALSDGVNWDPDADAAAELVISDGASWIEVVAMGGTL